MEKGNIEETYTQRPYSQEVGVQKASIAETKSQMMFIKLIGGH